MPTSPRPAAHRLAVRPLAAASALAVLTAHSATGRATPPSVAPASTTAASAATGLPAPPSPPPSPPANPAPTPPATPPAGAADPALVPAPAPTVAGEAPPNGTEPPAPPTRPCTERTARGVVPLRLRWCPPPIANPVLRYRPDALVVLGGGVSREGEATCATAQRAWAAARLDRRLGNRALVVLTGGGPHRAERDLDAEEVRCALRLRAQRIDEPETDDATRERLREELRDLRRTHRGSLTEAEHMCATMLRHQPGTAARNGLLARMVIESASQSTVQNATRTTPYLLRRGVRRVLLVTSPARARDGTVDNHAGRAAVAFRAARPPEASYDVAAVACPYVEGGEEWSTLDEHGRPSDPPRAARTASTTSAPPAAVASAPRPASTAPND